MNFVLSKPETNAQKGTGITTIRSVTEIKTREKQRLRRNVYLTVLFCVSPATTEIEPLSISLLATHIFPLL